jgi:hypothetical protein
MAVKVAGRGPEVVGVYTLFTALTTIAVFLRVYCRTRIVKKLGWDDWLAVAAWVRETSSSAVSGADISPQAVFMCFVAFAIKGTHHGTGQHAANLPPAEIPIGIKVC